MKLNMFMARTPPTPTDHSPPLKRVKVWDLPTRLFHWVLVILVACSFITGSIGGQAMVYHERCGVAILVLLLFRLVWGFIGGRHARFTTFVSSPAAVWRYAVDLIRNTSPRYLGHNPLGGWSILAMLTLLLVQVGTGLFANDDIFTEGPLFAYVAKNTSDWLTRIHLFNQKAILFLVAVHLGAILFYLVVKRENLIYPMISGTKRWHEEVAPTQNQVGAATAAILFLSAAVYLALY